MTSDADLPDEAAEWHRVAEERRRQLERLQQQRLYAIAARGLAASRRAAWVARRAVDPVRTAGLRLARSAGAAPSRVRAAARERDLRAALAALPAPRAGAEVSTLVTAVIVTAAQPERLDALLAALDRLAVPALVVDNAGVAAVADVVAAHPSARRLRLDAPRSYAAANEHAIAQVTTPWTLLLNDDVLPLEDTWLDRLLAATDAAPDAADAEGAVAHGPVVAVGAQLVHGRRGWLGGAAVDLTVQHAGIGLVVDGPHVRPVHLDRGAVAAPRVERRDVPAATAACLLVRTDAHRRVGGLHLGFDYGMEDVDLCLRLGAHGRVTVALDAVLLHEEGATRLVDRHGGDRRARTARQAQNRALLAARHGPALRRNLLDGSRPSARPTRLAIDGPVPADVARLAGIGSMPDAAPDAVPLRVVAGSTRRAGDAAARLVTDVRLLPDADTARSPGRGDVPVIAWGDDCAASALATPDVLDHVDVLVVADEALAARVRATVPTLPVRVVTTGDVAAAGAVLRQVLTAPRWSLRIGAPTGRGGERWGDVPVADALRRELRALGLVVRLAGRDRWGSGADATADVTVHLKGRGVAPVADGQRNLIWVFSHPSELAPGELDAADLVLAGSALLAQRLATRTSTPIVVLPQATDARRFATGAVDAALRSRLLFVGNTRSVARPAVIGAVAADLPLTLVGAGWERYLDPRRVTRTSVPPEELPAWYRAADVVLNDHWDEMRRYGIVANRVFDALACGACVLSDDVPGMRELLDDAVVTFTDADDLAVRARALLDDPEERAARAARGRAAVLAAHTWQHRAATLVAEVARLADVTQAGDTGGGA
jgi:GT2 family glycosyltransferase